MNEETRITFDKRLLTATKEQKEEKKPSTDKIVFAFASK